MSTKDTLLILKDLYIGSVAFMMLVLAANTFVFPHCLLEMTYFFLLFNYSHMQLATQQAHLHSLRYFQVLFPATALYLPL